MAEEERAPIPAWKVILAILGPITAAQLAVVGWFASRLDKVESQGYTCRIKVAQIESNRFTNHDANKLMESIFDKLPPQWLVRRVEKNETRLDRLEGRR